MSDAIARAEQAAAALIEERNKGLATRTDLQWTHALVALIAGVLILFWGLAGNLEVYVGQWTRAVVGALAVTGGLTLATALTVRRQGHPHPRLERFGLALVLILDLVLVVGFTWAVLEARPSPSWPWQQQAVTDPRPYPVAIYVGLVAMLRIHYVAARDHFRTHGSRS